MPKKPQPIESFARSLEAISLALEKCEGKEPLKCFVSALTSAKDNLAKGIQSYKEQQIQDAQFFAEASAYSIVRSVDCEKADEILKKFTE